jgi:hypothetical protein
MPKAETLIFLMELFILLKAITITVVVMLKKKPLTGFPLTLVLTFLFTTHLLHFFEQHFYYCKMAIKKQKYSKKDHCLNFFF